MRESLTHTVEDYLKTIYQFSTEGERVNTNQIANALEVTPASVTGMIKKLSNTDPPLVNYQKHQGVLLSKYGEQVALEIIRHHRLIEMFLHQVLGYEWDEVHAEADRLEHFISEEFEERIAIALGDPSHDPHGDPIPTRDLIMPEINTTPLSDLRPGNKAIVRQVINTDPEFLRYLGGLGIVPQSRIRVQDFSPYDENLKITIDDQNENLVLGYKITSQVLVEITS